MSTSSHHHRRRLVDSRATSAAGTGTPIATTTAIIICIIIVALVGIVTSTSSTTSAMASSSSSSCVTMQTDILDCLRAIDADVGGCGLDGGGGLPGTAAGSAFCDAMGLFGYPLVSTPTLPLRILSGDLNGPQIGGSDDGTFGILCANGDGVVNSTNGVNGTSTSSSSPSSCPCRGMLSGPSCSVCGGGGTASERYRSSTLAELVAEDVAIGPAVWTSRTSSMYVTTTTTTTSSPTTTSTNTTSTTPTTTNTTTPTTTTTTTTTPTTTTTTTTTTTPTTTTAPTSANTSSLSSSPGSASIASASGGGNGSSSSAPPPPTTAMLPNSSASTSSSSAPPMISMSSSSSSFAATSSSGSSSFNTTSTGAATSSFSPTSTDATSTHTSSSTGSTMSGSSSGGMSAASTSSPSAVSSLSTASTTALPAPVSGAYRHFREMAAASSSSPSSGSFVPSGSGGGPSASAATSFSSSSAASTTTTTTANTSSTTTTSPPTTTLTPSNISHQCDRCADGFAGFPWCVPVASLQLNMSLFFVGGSDALSVEAAQAVVDRTVRGTLFSDMAADMELLLLGLRPPADESDILPTTATTPTSSSTTEPAAPTDAPAPPISSFLKCLEGKPITPSVVPIYYAHHPVRSYLYGPGVDNYQRQNELVFRITLLGRGYTGKNAAGTGKFLKTNKSSSSYPSASSDPFSLGADEVASASEMRTAVQCVYNAFNNFVWTQGSNVDGNVNNILTPTSAALTFVNTEAFRVAMKDVRISNSAEGANPVYLALSRMQPTTLSLPPLSGGTVTTTPVTALEPTNVGAVGCHGSGGGGGYSELLGGAFGGYSSDYESTAKNPYITTPVVPPNPVASAATSSTIVFSIQRVFSAIQLATILPYGWVVPTTTTTTTTTTTSAPSITSTSPPTTATNSTATPSASTAATSSSSASGTSVSASSTSTSTPTTTTTTTTTTTASPPTNTTTATPTTTTPTTTTSPTLSEIVASLDTTFPTFLSLLGTTLSYDGIRTLGVAKGLYDEGMINLPQTYNNINGNIDAAGVVVKDSASGVMWTVPAILPPVLLPGIQESITTSGVVVDGGVGGVVPNTAVATEVTIRAVGSSSGYGSSDLFPGSSAIHTPSFLPPSLDRIRALSSRRAFAATHLPRFCSPLPAIVDPPPPPPSILLYWLIPLCVIGGIILIGLIYYCMFVRPYRVFEKQFITSRKDANTRRTVSKFELQHANDALDVEMLDGLDLETDGAVAAGTTTTTSAAAVSSKHLRAMQMKRSCSVFVPGMDETGNGGGVSGEGGGSPVAVKTVKGDETFNTKEGEEEYYRKRFIEGSLPPPPLQDDVSSSPSPAQKNKNLPKRRK